LKIRATGFAGQPSANQKSFAALSSPGGEETGEGGRQNTNLIRPNRPSQNEYRKRVPVRLHPLSCDFSATSCPCGIRISNGSRPPSSRPSPQGEGETSAAFLKIRATGFAGQLPSRPMRSVPPGQASGAARSASSPTKPKSQILQNQGAPDKCGALFFVGSGRPCAAIQFMFYSSKGARPFE